MTIALAGRLVLVTGASKGIGAACARAVAAAGGTVIGAARGQAALAEVIASLPGQGHRGVALDVADAAAWECAMASLREPLHGLIHAAGVLGPIGAVGDVDPAAFRAAVAVNLDGTFLALHHAVPRLRVAGGGAAVTFSGGGATGPLGRYDAYAASKAGVVRLAENVAVVAARDGVRVNAIAPGFVATSIHDATLAAGPEAAGVAYFERTRRDIKAGGVPAELAAELACFLLGPEADGITGRLISAEWDPWREEAFRARLRDEPDLATLRRIDDQFFTRVAL